MGSESSDVVRFDLGPLFFKYVGTFQGSKFPGISIPPAHNKASHLYLVKDDFRDILIFFPTWSCNTSTVMAILK